MGHAFVTSQGVVSVFLCMHAAPVGKGKESSCQGSLLKSTALARATGQLTQSKGYWCVAGVNFSQVVASKHTRSFFPVDNRNNVQLDGRTL